MCNHESSIDQLVWECSLMNLVLAHLNRNIQVLSPGPESFLFGMVTDLCIPRTNVHHKTPWICIHTCFIYSCTCFIFHQYALICFFVICFFSGAAVLFDAIVHGKVVGHANGGPFSARLNLPPRRSYICLN